MSAIYWMTQMLKGMISRNSALFLLLCKDHFKMINMFKNNGQYY